MTVSSSRSIGSRAPAAALSHPARTPVQRGLRRLIACLHACGDGQIPGAQLAIDGFIFLLSFLTAYLVRYDGTLSRNHLLQYCFWAPILVSGRLLLIRNLGVHRFLWRFVCLNDIIVIARALAFITLGLLMLRWLYPAGAAFAYNLRLPLGIIVPEFLLSLAGTITIRSVCRISQERRDRENRDLDRRRRRVLLYGAGRAGVMLVHELASDGELEVVGFLDDDPHKCNTVIAGVRVLGFGNALARVVRCSEIDEVMISVATPPPGMISHILSECKRIPIKTTIVPPAQEIISGRVKISRLREVRIEDLLGRSSAATGECAPQVRAAYQHKRVLVTGAGGSIGSELCRQLLLLKPAQLAILDKDENSIYELDHELHFCDPDVNVEPMVADIKIRERLDVLLKEFQPQVVVHAAAHKHVPLMEKHPCEAVLNNVLGMRNLLEVCRAVEAERFVFISSDKAVNPTNVMGATKRIGEKLLSLYTSGGGMKGAAVRFGNVMGSRGSVIPLFQKQIEQGGPVTVTHPEMTRFFMTIPEAVQLVLCAGSMAARSETFVLDMGNPRRVLDLAQQMIELAGLQPGQDILIEFTGLRPGEKMQEELACVGESLAQTSFKKIFEIPGTAVEEISLRRNLEKLIGIASLGDRQDLLRMLMSMGIGYQPLNEVVPPASDPDEIACAS